MVAGVSIVPEIILHFPSFEGMCQDYFVIIFIFQTLYTYPDNFRAFKALIAAKYSGAQVTLAKDFVFGETNKKPEFLNKFPLGKVPAFEGSDGVLLTESNAIAYYVANDELRGGSDAAARAQVRKLSNLIHRDDLFSQTCIEKY